MHALRLHEWRSEPLPRRLLIPLGHAGYRTAHHLTALPPADAVAVERLLPDDAVVTDRRLERGNVEGRTAVVRR